MSAGSQKRTRSQRVAALELPPGKISTLVDQLRSGAVVSRLVLAGMTAIALLAITRGWAPPRDFYLKQIPSRDVMAATEFRRLDERATSEAQARARRFAEAVYDNDPLPLEQLRAQVENEVRQLAGADDYDAVDQALWSRYNAPLAEGTPAPTAEEERRQFDKFREAFATEEAQIEFGRALQDVFAPFEQQGILDKQPAEANAEQVIVRRGKVEGFEQVAPVRSVLVDTVRAELGAALDKRLVKLGAAQHVFARLRPELPITLELDDDATRKQQEKRVADVEPVYKTYERGVRLAEAGQPLTESQIDLLEAAYQQQLAERTPAAHAARTAAVLWLYGATFAICGFGLYRSDRPAVVELPRYVTVLGAILLTVGGAQLAYGQPWRAELVPVLLFAMTFAIAYRQPSALLLTAAVTLVVCVGLGESLRDGVLLFAPAATAVAMLDSVRHRSKLLGVGLGAGLVAVATTLAVSALDEQPAWPSVKLAAATLLWSIVAGSLMTCVLPFVEKVFRVQTDLSLIELGDPAHPLLQELIRRAPGTYNHSITVASLAEAAAESIGARGLLVRVGAYFHDIGKMLKPGYFAENQALGGNSHDALVPAMSTLVIIAHVKDGADLARQNKVPECIIDFIQQHHGTTLVEFFYRQAQQKSQSAPDTGSVDETSFRYPGPKPQTKEAGVLMISDAVESASRTLVEPTPSRIEALVEKLIRARLDDGQFDECGLTLQDLRQIADSLVKSLSAVYHGRVKYPGQDKHEKQEKSA
ncbi:MAG: HD family phosphohydrolase [Lacipirellulaceae bacterium]